MKTPDPRAIQMSKKTEPDPTATRKPRRRFTPEQRIAARKAEIDAIEAAQRDRVREMIDKIRNALEVAADKADASGMAKEAGRCRAAITELDDQGEEARS